MKRNFLRHLITISIALLAFLKVNAQVATTYTWSQSFNTYTAITGTPIFAGTLYPDIYEGSPQTGWDDGYTGTIVPIGFPFTYNGSTYNNCYIEANGYIGFTSGENWYTDLLGSHSYADVIAGNEQDLRDYTSNPITFTTLGTQPNRTFVVQWTNASHYLSTSDQYNFQIRLKESGNVVEMMFGTCTYGSGETAQFGLGGTTTADYNCRQVTGSWTASTAGTVNSATCAYTASNLPPSGLTWDWAIVPCSGTPSTPTISATTGVACPGQTNVITATGYPGQPGIALQLQYSLNGYDWQNMVGNQYYVNPPAGGTTTFNIVNQSVLTYYRLIDTCVNSNLFAISNVLPIGIQLNCPCTTLYNNGGCNSGSGFHGIALLSVSGECGSSISYSNLNAICPNAAGYLDLSGTVPILKVYPGTTYGWNIEPGYVKSGVTGAWIDFDNSGVFTPAPNPGSEYVGGFINSVTTGYTNYSTNICPPTGTANSGICIPACAPIGLHRMRIRFATKGNGGTVNTPTITSIDPCTTYSNGMTLDYLVEVVPPPVASAASTPNPACTGQCVQFSTPNYGTNCSVPTNPTPVIAYHWTGPQGYTATDQNPTRCNLTNLMQGVYSVTVTVNNIATCTAGTTFLQVASTPVPVITPAGPIVMCAPACTTLTANAGYHYQWKKDGVVIAGATQQTYSACTTGHYTVVDTVISGACWAESAASVSVTVNPQPTATFTISGASTVCNGQCTNLQFTGTPSASVTVTGNGNPLPVSPIQLDPSGNYTLQVCPTTTTTYAIGTITDAVTGCTATGVTTATVTVNPLPTATLTSATPAAVCIGNCTILTFNGTPNTLVTYTAVPGGTQPPVTLNNSGVGTVSVCPTTTTIYTAGTVTNTLTTCSAPATGTVTVTVNPLPTVSVSAPSTVCTGSCATVTFTGTAGAMVNYNINGVPASVTLDGSGIATISVCPVVNTTTITLVNVTNPTTGCTQAVNGTAVITLLPAPTVSIAVTGTNPICSGSCTSVVFTGTPGANVSYNANGVAQAGIPLSTPAGTYTLTACPATTTVYSVTSVQNASTLCTATPVATATVTVNPQPTATITGTASVCKGNCTNLTITGTPNAQVVYSVTPAAQTFTVTLSPAGSYVISACPTVTSTYHLVSVTNLTTTCSQALNASVVVTVNPLPTAAFCSPNTSVCPGSCTTILLCGTPGATVTYVATPGGSQPPITLSNAGLGSATVCPAVNTVYTLSNVTNPATGCVANLTATVSVTIAPAPSPVITPQGPTEICQGGVVVLNANVVAGYTYQWYQDGVLIPGATDASYVTGQAGTYTVNETITGGCNTTSAGVTVVVDDVQATIQTNDPTSFCNGGQAVLVAPTGNGYLYQWLQNGAAISGASTSTYTATTSGSYQVVVTNGIGCGATSAITVITVYPIPVATVTALGPLEFCPYGSVTLMADTGTGYTYQWYNTNGPIPGATNVTYISTTSETDSVIVTSAFGCADTSTSVMTVLHPAPTAGITPEGPTTICFNQTVNLDAVTDIGVGFQWYFNGTAIPAATNQVYNVFVAGSYKVVITSAFGCMDTSATQYVLIEPQPQVGANSPTTFCQGATALLTVYTGNLTGPSLTYQWVKDGFTLVGATDATYEAQYAGIYHCLVSIVNICTDTSTSVTLHVNPLPIPVITGYGDYLSTGSFVNYQWFVNNIPIGTTQNINATQNGQYTVEVTDVEGCVGVSEPFVLTGYPHNNGGLGINIINADDIKIYPNPANATIHVQAPVKVNVTISGIDGKEIMRVNDAKDIDISKLPDAMYMLTVYSQSGERLKLDKLVKAGN